MEKVEEKEISLTAEMRRARGRIRPTTADLSIINLLGSHKCERLLFLSPRLSSVCRLSVPRQISELREIRAKFRRLYRKSVAEQEYDVRCYAETS